MKKHIILFIAIFFASVLHAQTINIRGTVTDTSNETLPGVSITIKGTQTGTVSDANATTASGPKEEMFWSLLSWVW